MSFPAYLQSSRALPDHGHLNPFPPRSPDFSIAFSIAFSIRIFHATSTFKSNRRPLSRSFSILSVSRTKAHYPPLAIFGIHQATPPFCTVSPSPSIPFLSTPGAAAPSTATAPAPPVAKPSVMEGNSCNPSLLTVTAPNVLSVMLFTSAASELPMIAPPPSLPSSRPPSPLPASRGRFPLTPAPLLSRLSALLCSSRRRFSSVSIIWL